MKSFLTITLAVFIFISCLSCGKKENITNDVTTSDSTAEETQSISQILGFPSEDNNGKEFTVLINISKAYEFDAEEVTGDVVNDAVYEKNRLVEDYLGISFKFVQENGAWNNRSVFNGIIASDVMSGSKEFDLVSGITVCTMPIAPEGYFIEGKSLPYVQFDKNWWISDMYERFSVDGSLYGFIGDASLSLYKDMTVIYFNKRIWDEYKAPNPYDLVRNNEWTLDKFIELCSGMSKDLNGDGKYDKDNDQLTFIGEYVPLGTFQTSLDLKVVTIGKDGRPEYIGLTEKFISAYEKLSSFHQQEGILRFSSIDDRSYTSMKTFANCNVASMCNFIYSTEYLRNMKDDYGILPMPKYDKNQEKYISQLGTSTTMFFVPVTSNDIELTSKVMEALSYYTHTLVIPKYYEVALKDKYARDDDIAEMLDIIRDGAAFDFLFVYGTSLQSAPNTYFRFQNAFHSDLASAFESSKTAFITSLEQMIEKYGELSKK